MQTLQIFLLLEEALVFLVGFYLVKSNQLADPSSPKLAREINPANMVSVKTAWVEKKRQLA